MQKEKVTQLGYKDHPYNTLLDEYEPGMTVEKIDAKFNPLKEQTLERIKNEATTKPKTINGTFNRDEQIKYSNQIATAMGYDFN